MRSSREFSSGSDRRTGSDREFSGGSDPLEGPKCDPVENSRVDLIPWRARSAKVINGGCFEGV